MNFDFCNGELTIYEKDSTSVDEGDIATLWATNKGKAIAMQLNEDYELVKEDDGYGKTIYVVKKID